MRDQLFYVGQKAIIEKDGKVLVLYREPLGIDFPGGKIQVGEYDLSASLMREVREETGLVVSDPKPFYTGYFTFHPDIVRKEKKETDFIYIVIYTVRLASGAVQLSDEHTSYDWVGKEDIVQLEDSGGLVTKALEKYFATLP